MGNSPPPVQSLPRTAKLPPPSNSKGPSVEEVAIRIEIETHLNLVFQGFYRQAEHYAKAGDAKTTKPMLNIAKEYLGSAGVKTNLGASYRKQKEKEYKQNEKRILQELRSIEKEKDKKMTIIHSISTGVQNVGAYLQAGYKKFMEPVSPSQKNEGENRDIVFNLKCLQFSEKLNRFLEGGGSDKTKNRNNQNTKINLKILESNKDFKRFLESVGGNPKANPIELRLREKIVETVPQKVVPDSHEHGNFLVRKIVEGIGEFAVHLWQDLKTANPPSQKMMWNHLFLPRKTMTLQRIDSPALRQIFKDRIRR
jgi:hypothetical protein